VRFTELDPHWLTREDDRHFGRSRSIQKADGVQFLCPKCFEANGGSKGTHSVICWQPHVPQSTPPTPGRWRFEGRGFRTLTLRASSSSILLTGGGCGAHFWIRQGEVVPCGPNWT
jgi:hypothetical protein